MAAGTPDGYSSTPAGVLKGRLNLCLFSTERAAGYLASLARHRWIALLNDALL
jgi:hypothetical protein